MCHGLIPISCQPRRDGCTSPSPFPTPYSPLPIPHSPSWLHRALGLRAGVTRAVHCEEQRPQPRAGLLPDPWHPPGAPARTGSMPGGSSAPRSRAGRGGAAMSTSAAMAATIVMAVARPSCPAVLPATGHAWQAGATTKPPGTPALGSAGPKAAPRPLPSRGTRGRPGCSAHCRGPAAALVNADN